MVRLAVLLALVALIIACDSSEVDKEKEVIEPFIVKHDSNYFLYNEKFAKRFNLPADGVVGLDGGLFAIGFHLKTDNSEPTRLTCILKLFVDSNLDVATPTEERGSRERWSESSEAGFFMGDSTPKAEFHWAFEQYTTQSYNTLRVVSKSLDKRGVPKSFSDTGIASYDKEYLKGITYLSSDISCGTIIGSSVPYEVHLKKNSYLGRFGPSTPGYDFENQPENLIRFDIPNRLIYAVIPVIEKDYEEYVKRVKSGLDNGIQNSDGPRFKIPPMVDFSEE